MICWPLVSYQSEKLLVNDLLTIDELSVRKTVGQLVSIDKLSVNELSMDKLQVNE